MCCMLAVREGGTSASIPSNLRAILSFLHDRKSLYAVLGLFNIVEDREPNRESAFCKVMM